MPELAAAIQLDLCRLNQADELHATSNYSTKRGVNIHMHQCTYPAIVVHEGDLSLGGCECISWVLIPVDVIDTVGLVVVSEAGVGMGVQGKHGPCNLLFPKSSITFLSLSSPQPPTPTPFLPHTHSNLLFSFHLLSHSFQLLPIFLSKHSYSLSRPFILPPPPPTSTPHTSPTSSYSPSPTLHTPPSSLPHSPHLSPHPFLTLSLSSHTQLSCKH